jgi:hypothetical protein
MLEWCAGGLSLRRAQFLEHPDRGRTSLPVSPIQFRDPAF